jgi:hypothetical protein
LEFRYNIAAALAVFVLLIGIVFTIQWVYLNREASTTHGGYQLDETFTVNDFR